VKSSSTFSPDFDDTSIKGHCKMIQLASKCTTNHQGIGKETHIVIASKVASTLFGHRAVLFYEGKDQTRTEENKVLAVKSHGAIKIL